MKYHNYQKIVSDLIRDLPEKTKTVLEKRFGLVTGQTQTLDKIGKSPEFGVTRERIRQIEFAGLRPVREKAKRNNLIVFEHFRKYLKSQGGIKRESLLLEDLGPANFKNHILFLLTIGEGFDRFRESEFLHSFWSLGNDSLSLAENIIEAAINRLRKEHKPLPISAFGQNTSPSFFELSKLILKTEEDNWGLKEWPEVNPRFVRDKTYLSLKRAGEPLHFTEIAQLIASDNTNPQTVHNELIKDPRFVLVGRGTYALQEWGYFPGIVKEVIAKILSDSDRPLAREEVLEKTKKQRMVKPGTILLSLQDKNLFNKDSEGKYSLKDSSAALKGKLV